jgi:hypothetical protein
MHPAFTALGAFHPKRNVIDPFAERALVLQRLLDLGAMTALPTLRDDDVSFAYLMEPEPAAVKHDRRIPVHRDLAKIELDLPRHNFAQEVLNLSWYLCRCH